MAAVGGRAGGRGGVPGGPRANAPSAAPAGRGRGAAGGPVKKPPWQGPMDAKGGVQQENKRPGADANYVQESLATTLPRFVRSVHVGDRIIDKHSKRTGMCMYIGPADFAKGKEVCGLRLDKMRTTTDCDGKYRGERYFRCSPGHGLYIPLEDAEYLGEAGDDDFAHLNGAGGGAPASGGGIPKGNQIPRDPAAGADNALQIDPNFDLEKELEPIVGLHEVKDMLRGMRNAVEVRKKRAGMGVNDDRTMHMLFLGNPGTGKTTIARLAAKMLASIGILKKGQLIEVTRKVSAATLHCRTTHAPLWPRCTHAHTPR